MPEKPLSTSDSETKKIPLFPSDNGNIKPDNNTVIENGNEPQDMLSDIQEVGSLRISQQILERVEDTATTSEKTEEQLEEKPSIPSIPDDKHRDEFLVSQEHVYLCPFQGCSLLLTSEVSTNIYFVQITKFYLYC